MPPGLLAWTLERGTIGVTDTVGAGLTKDVQYEDVHDSFVLGLITTPYTQEWVSISLASGS